LHLRDDVGLESSLKGDIVSVNSSTGLGHSIVLIIDLFV